MVWGTSGSCLIPGVLLEVEAVVEVLLVEGPLPCERAFSSLIDPPLRDDKEVSLVALEDKDPFPLP